MFSLSSEGGTGKDLAEWVAAGAHRPGGKRARAGTGGCGWARAAQGRAVVMGGRLRGEGYGSGLGRRWQAATGPGS
jgi:hypothetical protein